MKKFGTIELGIPAYMTYKGVPISSLTKKTDSIRTRDNKKSIKLIPDTDGKLEIINKGKRDADGALEFGTVEFEVPATVVKRKRLVKTLTDKSKQPTRRKGVQSIRLRGIDDEVHGKVRIINKGQEVAIVERILKKLEEAPIPKKDISALKAKFQMAFKRLGFKKAVEQMREVAKKYADKEREKKEKEKQEKRHYLQDDVDAYYEKKKKKTTTKKASDPKDEKEYADKWEWLRAQDNWRKILNSIGVKKISLSTTRDEVVDSLKKRAPSLPIPWKEEDKEKLALFNEVEKLVKKLKEFIGSQADRNLKEEKPTEREQLIKKIGSLSLSRNSSMDELKDGKTNVIKAIEFYENLTKEYERQMKEKRANAPPMEAPKIELRTFKSTGEEVKSKN